MSDDILFHVGYIKTATTYLQNQIQNGSLPGLALGAGKETRAQLVANFILADDFEFDAQLPRERLAAFNHDIQQRGCLPVWSEETLLGNPPSSRYDGYLNARKIKACYPNARILITVRKQQDIVLSIYREYVLGGGNLQLEQFIGTGDESLSYSPLLRAEFLHFDRAVGHYIQLFGEDRVLVLPQELLNSEPDTYYQLFSNFTGKSFSAPKYANRDHAAENYFTFQLRRKLNPLFPKDPCKPVNSGYRKTFNRVLFHLNRLPGMQQSNRKFEKFRQTISNRYKHSFVNSNRNLMAITGLPLDQLGYDT
ncbi:hypothetical protein PVT68_10815 [Microbulbifer bruguierae]|uniref:Sulfotransferase domain-containing protein n=1 Tax=Microbulbifer bruguierae TaxID=3029061 RepID=A0ABY8NB03_9GAMM|nr:hypothetical protein [Microbulbifer bruguierae]WGL15262.1 hypothetical protein PVT68_10815 [Microbulbifer bruguierae]